MSSVSSVSSFWEKPSTSVHVYAGNRQYPESKPPSTGRSTPTKIVLSSRIFEYAMRVSSGSLKIAVHHDCPASLRIQCDGASLVPPPNDVSRLLQISADILLGRNLLRANADCSKGQNALKCLRLAEQDPRWCLICISHLSSSPPLTGRFPACCEAPASPPHACNCLPTVVLGFAAALVCKTREACGGVWNRAARWSARTRR